MANYSFAQVGIDTPLRTVFDYRIPAALQHVQIGMRVQVPFGRRKVIGIVVQLSHSSQVEPRQLKNLQSILDPEPLLDRSSLTLIEWAANYYQFPVGSALFSALPPMLRKGKAIKSSREHAAELRWFAIDGDLENIRRAPKQTAIYQWLQKQTHGAYSTELNEQFPNSRSSLLALEKHGLVNRKLLSLGNEMPSTCAKDDKQLTEEQLSISSQLSCTLDSFVVHLIEGVTGSGKTEIYFNVIEDVLAEQSSQILILVPEIGLAPQMLQRLQARFGNQIGVLHSSIGESERKKTWLDIGNGKIKIILGTRLAVFTPIPNLKLIIVDEEHDASFKQHEGFLYHARDVAIYRAQKIENPDHSWQCHPFV